jgi:type VI secretion system protein ImpC
MTGQDDERGGGVAGFRVGFGEAAAPGSADDEPGGTFRIVVVGGFAANADVATGARPRPSAPLVITPETFDEVMSELNPSLTIEVPDPSAPREKPLRLTLSFPKVRSFRPDVVVKEVDAFRALQREPDPAPAASPPTAASGGSGSLIDDILAGMTGSSPSPAKPPATASDERKGALLGSILGHQEVRRLERAWRGLKLLVDRAGRGGVVVAIVSAEVDEVETALARAAKASAGGAIDLFVVDYEVGATARDLERAERWAACAESVPAPLVTNGRPELLGFDDLAQLARTNRRIRGLEDARAVAFRALTEKDATRWLVLAMNGVFLRAAHTAETARLPGSSFVERAPLEGSAAWVVAAAAASAFVGCGWACALTQPKYRTLADLPVHLVGEQGAEMSIAAESFVPAEVASEAAAAGVTVLTAVRDRDAVVLPVAQMAYRGPVGPQGVRGAAELTLADQLFVARMVPLITELAATIPHDADAAAARDTAKIALLSLFASDAPVVDARIVRETKVLEVTIRPRGFRGVDVPEVVLSAALG